MKTNKLQIIDGETLMSRPLRPMNFVVDSLLSQGLHILAGSPKVGKSYLALWLAVTIAKGEPVWSMNSKQGTVLYLCLEDSTLRIQNRLFEITEDAPPNVYFCTDSAVLGKGLEQQLEGFLSEHPDTVLVIIDTLQLIRGTNYDNTYANDYTERSASDLGRSVLAVRAVRPAAVAQAKRWHERKGVSQRRSRRELEAAARRDRRTVYALRRRPRRFYFADGIRRLSSELDRHPQKHYLYLPQRYEVPGQQVT